MQKDIKDFKTQRSGRQRDLKKTTGFLKQNNNFARALHANLVCPFLCPFLHDYDVKMPVFAF